MNDCNWALFDFCETLVNFQTADSYVEFVENRIVLPYSKMARRIHAFLKRTKILLVLSILFPKASINKKLVLLRLRGLKSEVADILAKEYYYEKIKPNLIGKIVSELRHLQNNCYNIVVVSGGYGIYLKFFCEDFNIKYLICSEIDIRDGLVTGFMKGKDCLWENKIWYIERNDVYNDIVHSDNTVSYSDSKSDLPLLTWTKRGVVVSRYRSQEWHKQYNLKEIIW